MKARIEEKEHGEATVEALIKLKQSVKMRNRGHRDNSKQHSPGKQSWSKRLKQRKELQDIVIEQNLSSRQSSARNSAIMSPKGSQRQPERLEQPTFQKEIQDLDKKISQVPYSNVFAATSKPLGQYRQEALSKRSISGSLATLSQRDLYAYFAKISWPQKLYKDPIPMSNSYINPNMTPNRCIGDSDQVALQKLDQVVLSTFIAFYLGSQQIKKDLDKK